ncbi:hypothetical protein MKX07_008746 [Trichoderma sp. CBMAI-0711]|nr:hypothetical protein MKX07_008746 [Trichoderma sp. CBMAI-0711]
MIHLDLAPRSGNDLAKLVGDALEKAQAVVLGQRLEEVLERGAAGASLLDELGDDGRLVGGRQGRRGEDADQLGVLVEEAGQLGELFGGGVEGRRLGGRGVLEIDAKKALC